MDGRIVGIGASGKVLLDFAPGGSHIPGVYGVAVSPDGLLVAAITGPRQAAPRGHGEAQLGATGSPTTAISPRIIAGPSIWGSPRTAAGSPTSRRPASAYIDGPRGRNCRLGPGRSRLGLTTMDGRLMVLLSGSGEEKAARMRGPSGPARRRPGPQGRARLRRDPGRFHLPGRRPRYRADGPGGAMKRRRSAPGRGCSCGRLRPPRSVRRGLGLAAGSSPGRRRPSGPTRRDAWSRASRSRPRTASCARPRTASCPSVSRTAPTPRACRRRWAPTSSLSIKRA